MECFWKTSVTLNAQYHSELRVNVNPVFCDISFLIVYDVGKESGPKFGNVGKKT